MKKTFSKEILFDRTPRVFKRDATEVRFLLGGIGTGNFSVNSRGKFLDWEIFNWPSKNTKFPLSFFAIRTENKELERPISKILESRMVPPYTSSHGYLQAELVNLPRMEDSELICEYPFARVNFKDSELPVKVSMEAYTPFIPLNTDDSSIPCAIIRYTVKNIADCPTKVSLVGTLPNASGFEGYDVIENLKLADSVKNEYREFDDVKGLYYSPEHLKEDHLRYGNMAILTSGSKVTYKTQWFDGEWVDGIQDFWDDFTSDGRLEKETVSDSVGCEFAQFHNFSFLKRREKIGSIGAWEELQPGEERTFEFVITWYFPNRVKAWIEFDEDYEKFQRGEYGTVRNYYATKFTDAWDVAKYVYHNKERLESDSRKFADAMFHKTTLPYYVVDALTANITNLRSNLCFRLEDGTFAGFEGIRDYIGCGYGSVPHVWNYAQTVAFLLSLTDELSRNAEFIALKAAKNNGIIISYDPNYRASLWDSQEEACKWMRSILEYADIVKVSEEEIELLTGYTDVRKAAESITEYGAKIVLITLGEKGSFVYLQDQQEAYVSGYSSKVVDTTGAGDSFMGGFLYKICESGKRIEEYSLQEMIECVRFGNAMASLCVEREGAIPAMPVMEEVIKRINS